MKPSSRRNWPLVAAALAGSLAVTPLPAAPLPAVPLDVIRDCAAKLPAEVSGIENLETACPGLEDAIQALGLDRILYDGWREQLDRNSLQDVSGLAGRYSESKPAAGPDAAALPGILTSMAKEQGSVAKSWWDAFKAWLNSWFQSHDPDSLSWLDRWLDRMRESAGLLSLVLYSLMGLVVIAAGWVVVNELRAAGIMARRRRRGRRAAVIFPGRAPDEAVNVNSEPTSQPERVAALLRLLVSGLMRTGRLRSERSLTHRELVTLGSFDSEAQRAVFAAVAGSAEAILYGAHVVSAGHLDRVLRDGRILLAQLPDAAGRR